MTDYKGYFSEKEKLAHRYSREKKHGRRWVVLCEAFRGNRHVLLTL